MIRVILKIVGQLLLVGLATLKILDFVPYWFSWWSAGYRWPFFCLVLVIYLLVALTGAVRSIQQKQNLTHLIHELNQIANQKPEHIITWQAKSAPQVQKLIDAFNRIIRQSQILYQEEVKVERSKDEMMGNISHDLRTPLTTIIGYLGLVVMQDQQLSPEEQQKYIQTAYDKSNQMKVLVEDLFEFSKTQFQDVNLNITEFNVGDLFAQLLATYELEAQERKIKLTYLTDPALIIMDGDSDKLARAFMNLLNNAFKYAQGASFIKLTAQVRDNDEVEMRVTNDGTPIPADAVDSLFERFYRVESSRNSKTGGTGLGLAIVKGIVNQHSGRVWVESNQVVTSFVIVMPIHQLERRKNAE